MVVGQGCCPWVESIVGPMNGCVQDTVCGIITKSIYVWIHVGLHHHGECFFFCYVNEGDFFFLNPRMQKVT